LLIIGLSGCGSEDEENNTVSSGSSSSQVVKESILKIQRFLF